MKKLKFLGLSLLLLALLLTGCDGGGDSGESDTWSYANASQLNGTWKGSSSVSRTMREWGQIWDWDMTDSRYDELFGNMSMKVNREVILVINEGRATGSTKTVESFSGGKVNTAFPMLVDWWQDENPIVDNSKRTMTYNYDIDPFTYSDTNRWIQINQNGKKIKLIGESIYTIPVEYILTKQ